MSRTLLRPTPDAARAVATVLFLAISLVHFVTLPHGFQIGGYVGVSLVLGLMMGVAGAIGLLIETKDRTWWYALYFGLANAVGWMATRLHALPATDLHNEGGWHRETGLCLVFCGTALAALAAWVLRTRWLDRHETVESARDRALNHW